jgi:hypothetical protein
VHHGGERGSAIAWLWGRAFTFESISTIVAGTSEIAAAQELDDVVEDGEGSLVTLFSL